MNIAVIGGGISGLGVAYYLNQAGHQVSVFESSYRFGGAAHTMEVQMGDVTRWADMGVNDFNAVTYTNLVGLLDKFGVPYKPLLDTESFSTLDGSVSYTLDGRWNTTTPEDLQQEYQRFQTEAPTDAANPDFQNFSIKEYLAAKNYTEDFGRLNIYPRVNGMYFVEDTTPEEMPFVGIMHYYMLQEGFGGQAPQRMYFANGTKNWAYTFAQYLFQQGVQFQLGAKVSISASASNVVLHVSGEHFGSATQADAQLDGEQIGSQALTGDQTFDACVTACHASTALNLFQDGITQDMVNVLSAFEYRNSVAVAHTYARLLPVDKNAWRTYNITVHDNFEQLRPYTISYVCNLHQNDPANPAYDHFDEPYFFVTLNPSIPIPDRYVLRSSGGLKAVAHFPHNVVSLQAIAAQAQLPYIQGQNNMYFCGGWTVGAGLQEECLISAQSVASHITTGVAQREHLYNTAPDAKHYAPDYIRAHLAQAKLAPQ